ncbi:MAG: arsenosugar biosynthesis radical SAM (seleno)protein ArsS [Planctomycetota bacterium]
MTATLNGNGFDLRLQGADRYPLRARSLQTLQVNLGRLCNQRCAHCHVGAGPERTGAKDNMGSEVAELVVRTLRSHAFATLDLTGGAPELNPNFRYLVTEARGLGLQVIDRCNLTVLFVPGQEDLPEFLAEHGVEVTASLPYYTERRTDTQRGSGVFGQSIKALRRLNALGYGDRLPLNLVYNPCGAYLPGPQEELEEDFRQRLLRDHGIRFSRLLVLANMPIRRFLDYLELSGNEGMYRRRLEAAFNPRAADEVMCRDLISVGPDGTLYDCDFNQMLELGLARKLNLRDFDAALAERRIVTGRHCFGCTAGAGSSCGGAVVKD